MSDILIRDMEMPKDGSWVTLRVFPDGQCFLYSWCGNDFDFMEHLTAVPVPPHGDLIEKSVIEKAINDACAECKEACIEFDGFFADCNQCIFQAVKKALVEAPTVIEAEEGET